MFRPLDEEGDPLYDATCPGRKGAPVEVLAQLPAGDGDEPSEGPTVWLECEFSPMPDDGYVVVARDVSARKQMEDDRADFLTTVSFELRTPLAPLKRFLETLRQRDSELDDLGTPARV